MPCDWNPSAEYKVYVGFDRGVLLKDDHKRCLKEMVKTFKDCFKHWDDSVNECSLAEQIAWAHMVIGAITCIKEYDIYAYETIGILYADELADVGRVAGKSI